MADANLHAEKVAEAATTEDEIEIIEDAPAGDKRLSGADDEEDGGAESADEAEREALREKRREERRQRRDRQSKARDRDKSYIDSLERQTREMAERLAALEGRTLQQDARDVDARLSQASQEMQTAERALKEAIAKGDGELFSRAMKVRDDASARARELQSVKTRISAPAPAPAGVDPSVARMAQEWAADHAWYDPSGRDQDSAIVATIDAKLAEEGLDPRSEDYWDELSDRVERALPHKFKAKGKRSSPPVSGGREHAPQSTRTQIHVSKEMREHLEQAGYWDDPVKRQKVLKRYAEQQKNNPAR